jgi:hypothetical protein
MKLGDDSAIVILRSGKLTADGRGYTQIRKGERLHMDATDCRALREPKAICFIRVHQR